MATGAAKVCYGCGRIGCGDPFNKDALGVEILTSETGWCTVCDLISLIFFHRRFTKCFFLSFQKVKTSAASVTSISRGSDIFDCTKNQCNTQKYQGIEATLCCCNTDKCNGASRSISMITFNFLASLLALAFAKRFY